MERASRRKHHYIYKITCKVTQRYYIGMHSTDNLEDGYFGSGKRLWNSINYHGKENHEKEILEFCSDRAELKAREKELVNEELLKEDLCMNLIIGGEGGGGFSSEQQKLNSKKGYEKIKYLIETNPQWVAKRKQNFSKARKKDYEIGVRKKGVFYNRFGKPHSTETKEKIGKANSIKQKGVYNSQYGTCWITRDGENKKIKKEDLDLYISDGWIKGRK